VSAAGAAAAAGAIAAAEAGLWTWVRGLVCLLQIALVVQAAAQLLTEQHGSCFAAAAAAVACPHDD